MKRVWWIWILLVSAGHASFVPWFVDFMSLESPEWAYREPAAVTPIVVSNGHFFSSSGRVRFFGVNITGDKNFPLKVDAPRIARSLRLLGVNLVRLHFMDYSWSDSLLVSGDGDQMDTNALDRLDYFVSCLKREGIYVDMNLHVGRVFPDIPPEDRKVFPLGKVVDYLDDKLLMAQKRYATSLLGHTNPYTGLPYTQDPVVAVIEVDNENALTGVSMDALASLSPYYQEILRSMWNSFLHQRYARYDEWLDVNLPHKTNEKPLEVIQTNHRQRFLWRWEAHQGASSILTWENETIVWRVEKPGKEAWHNQWMCGPLSMTGGTVYEVQWEARSPSSLPLEVFLMQDREPWQGLGWYTNLSLSPRWQVYRFRFMPERDESRARINFATRGDAVGVVEMRNFVLRELQPQVGNQMLWEKYRMPLPWEGLAGKRVMEDVRTMLLQREQAVVQAMREHIRSLGCTKPITHTQADYGGWAGLVREARFSDFVDMHAYWQHPVFPQEAWSEKNWFIGNTSQLLDERLGPLSYVAYWRVAGKPFTVSEYNVPDPNWYGYEAPIWLALWGAFQDWDGVYVYTLLDFGGRYYQKHMAGFFHFIGSGAKMSLLPWAVRVYFRGIHWPYTVVRGVDLATYERWYQENGLSYDVRQHGFDGKESLVARVAVDPRGKSVSQPALRMPWEWDRQRPGLLWGDEYAFLLTGNIAGYRVTNQWGRLEVDPRSPWGAIALCTLDDAPWQKTRRVLAVIVGRGENTGMQWNATHTSVGNQWGRPPYVLIQPRGRLSLPGFRAYALDERGQKEKEIPIQDGWVVFDEKTKPWILFEK